MIQKAQVFLSLCNIDCYCYWCAYISCIIRSSAVIVWPLPTFIFALIDQPPPEPKVAVAKAPELTLT